MSDYSPTMSCCRSAHEHTLHTAADRRVLPEGWERWYPAGCPCFRCDSQTWPKTGTLLDSIPRRMNLCPSCGNKRCPGAADHERHR